MGRRAHRCVRHHFAAIEAGVNPSIDEPVDESRLLEEFAQRIDHLLLASGRDLPHVHHHRLRLVGRHLSTFLSDRLAATRSRFRVHPALHSRDAHRALGPRSASGGGGRPVQCLVRGLSSRVQGRRPSVAAGAGSGGRARPSSPGAQHRGSGRRTAQRVTQTTRSAGELRRRPPVNPLAARGRRASARLTAAAASADRRGHAGLRPAARKVRRRRRVSPARQGPRGHQAHRGRRLGARPHPRSHRQYRHPERPGLVTIAGKPSDTLHPKTWASIIRQAGLEDDR